MRRVSWFVMKELIKKKGVPVALSLAFALVLAVLVVGLVSKNDQLVRASLLAGISVGVGASALFMAKLR